MHSELMSCGFGGVSGDAIGKYTQKFKLCCTTIDFAKRINSVNVIGFKDFESDM